VLLLAAAGVAAWFAYTKIQEQLNNSKPVGVPDVVGLKEAQALDKLHNFGFSAHILRNTSDTIPLGVVISQSPNAGFKAPKGSSVEVDISKGKEKVSVPSVLGKTEADAVSTLTNAGLKANVFSVHSAKPPNTVTGQDPPPGTMIVKGSRVRINVSSGPAPVSVPYVVGLQYDEAATQLQNAGFAIARKNVDSDKPKGEVVAEEPTGSAAPGATITLSVSKGPKLSEVPDVTNQDEASAKATLQSAGFKVVVERQDVNDPALEGIVLSQSPGGGTKAPQGSTVTITVGKISATPPPPPIP
jgi:beta-lactam-binding protein with PASTA domain